MRRHESTKQREQRGPKVIDRSEEEETARRVAAMRAKRQKVINDVELSVKRRRFDRMAIEGARADGEAGIRQKEIRDAAKVRGEKAMSQIRREIGAIVEAGVESVQPSAILPKKIRYDGRATLTIKNVKYKINNNVHIVGWGKEAVVAATALERMLGRQVKRGFMVVPRGSISMMWSYPAAFPKLDSRITFVEAGTGGLPDRGTVEITRKIAGYCKRLKKRDLLIVMLSRDADNLLCCPRDTITLRDKLRLLGRLTAADATAAEVDVVRNKLSAIRGGDLARRAYPARVVTLVMSDASAESAGRLLGGPCVYDPKDQTALAVLLKYGLVGGVSQSVRELLGEYKPRISAADGRLDERRRYRFVQECVLACNEDAAESMATQAIRLGLTPVTLNLGLGAAGVTIDELAREYARIASLAILAAVGEITELQVHERMKGSPLMPVEPMTDRQDRASGMFPARDKWGLGLCLVLTGRPTTQADQGGPNQELALRFAVYWYTLTRQRPILRGYTVWFAGVSSCGRDGNTGAAGAFGYGDLAVGVHPEYEKACDVYRTALLKWRRLAEGEHGETEITEAARSARAAEAAMEGYAAVLPDRVLQENNANLFFSCVNQGDELLQLKGTDYYAPADTGDLHVIRIARYRCNCESSGACHVDEAGIRADRD